MHECVFSTLRVEKLETEKGLKRANSAVSSCMRLEDRLLPGPIHVVACTYSANAPMIADRFDKKLGKISGNTLIVKGKDWDRPRGGGPVDDDVGLELIAGKKAVELDRAKVFTPRSGGRFDKVHPKCMLLFYKYGLRLLITTMNLVPGSAVTTEALVTHDFPYKEGCKTFFTNGIALLKQLKGRADDDPGCLPPAAKDLCSLFMDPALGLSAHVLDWLIGAILTCEMGSARWRLRRSTRTSRGDGGPPLGLEGISKLVAEKVRLPADVDLAAVVTSSSVGGKENSTEAREKSWLDGVFKPALLGLLQVTGAAGSGGAAGGAAGNNGAGATNVATSAKNAATSAGNVSSGGEAEAEKDESDGEEEKKGKEEEEEEEAEEGEAAAEEGASVDDNDDDAAAGSDIDEEEDEEDAFQGEISPEVERAVARLHVQLFIPTVEEATDCVKVSRSTSKPRGLISKKAFRLLREAGVSIYHWLPARAQVTIDRLFALPHIKTIALCQNTGTLRGLIFYFILGSANMSRGALGFLTADGTKLLITNVELGVFFCPELEREFRRHPHRCFDLDMVLAEKKAEEEGVDDVWQFLGHLPEQYVEAGREGGERLKTPPPPTATVQFWHVDAPNIPEPAETDADPVIILRLPIAHDVPAHDDRLYKAGHLYKADEVPLTKD